MSNVIHVDFGNKKQISAKERFLSICQDALDENDYLDLIDAINDIDFFNTCDEDIKELVEIYHYGT